MTFARGMARYLYEREYKQLPLHQRTIVDSLWFQPEMTDSEESELTETEATQTETETDITSVTVSSSSSSEYSVSSESTTCIGPITRARSSTEIALDFQVTRFAGQRNTYRD
jgi:hypothetical protein